MNIKSENPPSVLEKSIEVNGAEITVLFKENSNPQALFLFRKNLISSILRQINENQCTVSVD